MDGPDVRRRTVDETDVLREEAQDEENEDDVADAITLSEPSRILLGLLY